MPHFHGFGDSRASAEGSGFFRWFSLEPSREESPAPSRRKLHYRPEGSAFQQLTEVVLALDERDQLEGLELRLARGFIDHPRDGLFARDITKSLLRDALTGENGFRLADLVNEIEFPREGTAPVLTARRVDVVLPDVPTPGYQVFLGRRGRYEERLPELTLVLENYVRDAAGWLRVALTLRATSRV